LLIKNIIINDLYNKSLVGLLGWFVGSFQYYETFRLFTSKNNYYDEVRTNYNNFKTDDDICDYIDLEENYIITLTNCLQNNLEDLAM
jgi:hypothetical protein